MPSPRAKTNNLEIALDDYLIKNASAKGKRVSNRVIRRVSATNGISPEQPRHNLTLPGLDRVPKTNPDDDEPMAMDDGEENNDQ